MNNYILPTALIIGGLVYTITSKTRPAIGVFFVLLGITTWWGAS